MIIYKYNAAGVVTIFSEIYANKAHRLSMGRHMGNDWFYERPQSQDECEAQYEGLSRIYDGEDEVRIKSDHHTFEFTVLDNDEVEIRCITKGAPDDSFTIEWEELEEMIEGLAACLEWYSG
jgi:hypothetical protein